MAGGGGAAGVGLFTTASSFALENDCLLTDDTTLRSIDLRLGESPSVSCRG